MNNYSVTLIWSADSSQAFHVQSPNFSEALLDALNLAILADGEIAATGLASWVVIDTQTMDIAKGDYTTAPSLTMIAKIKRTTGKLN